MPDQPGLFSGRSDQSRDPYVPPVYTGEMDVPLPTKTFKNRKQAVAFLKANPDFVRARFGNLSKGSPKLLAAAGYKVAVQWSDGKPKYNLSQNGKVIHSYPEIPKADGRQYINIRAAKPTPPAPPRGGDKPRGGAAPPMVPPMAPAASVTSAPAMDYGAVAASLGIDPKLFKGLNPNTGNLLPLALARSGAQTMGPDQQNALVKSLIGDQYSRQETVMGQERARMDAQNKMNLSNIRGWYDQVMQSQGVAAQRDEAFGKAAVDSMTEATGDIVSALGGAANEGSYVVGAAGQENIGNLQAVGTIQNQYNADMAPLLQAEGAGQMAREQAMGSSRTRDLSMRLAELQSGRSSAEADLRFKLWQSNNEVLNQRLQNELAIRQANSGMRQQRFNNNVGLRQMMMAAQAGAAGNVADIASVAQRDAESQRDAQIAANKEAWDRQMDVAKEQGKMYRAQLGQNAGNTWRNAKSDQQDGVWQLIADRAAMNPNASQKQRVQMALAVVRGVWPKASLNNRALQEWILDAIEAGTNPEHPANQQ